MKQASTTLFEIISRMTDDEKKYFRVYSTILKQFNHLSTARLLELFEVVNAIKVYDEKRLKRNFNATNNKGSFKTYKSVLREFLLESLHAQHNGSNATDIHNRQLNHAQSLVAKDLNQQALAYLNHLKHQLDADKQHHNPLLTFQLLTLKNKVLNNMPGSNATDKVANRIELYKQTLIMQYEEQQELTISFLEQMVSQRLLLNTEADTKQLKELQKITQCYASRVNNPNYYYVVKQGIYMSLLEGNFAKHLDYCHHLFSHYQQLADKNQLSGNAINEYGNSFIALIRACELARDAEMVMLTFNIAKGPYSRLFYNHPYYYPFFRYALLLMYQFDSVPTYLVEEALRFETGYCPVQPENNMLAYRWFYTSLAVIYHSTGNYKSALINCHKVVSTNPHDLTEIHCRDFCTVFQFVIEYNRLPVNNKNELGSDTLLQTTLNKLKREHGLTDEKKNRSFELCILGFLSNPSEEARKLCLAELSLLRDLPATKHFDTLFNFEQWLGKYPLMQNVVA